MARGLGSAGVHARRFFCDEPSCERRIFCERLPDVAARARKTNRLEEALLAIVTEPGGRAGAKLAAELGLAVGRDALLSRAKRANPTCDEKVRVIGIENDFAFRKGNAYGTILVDLERHKVVDLLPECSQESLSAWPERLPGVEVATRDRSRIYREGIAKGAPDAVLLADRWHLLRSFALGLEELLLRKRPALERAAKPGAGGAEGQLPGFDRRTYRQRNEVECLIGRLKQWRRIATRYEERASSYLALLTLASITPWL